MSAVSNKKGGRWWLVSCSVVSNSLWPHGLQYARLPCPSPRLCSKSIEHCSLSEWCHLTISFSVVPFFSCPQSFPASGSFPMNQLFTSGGQNTGASVSASVLPMHVQGWFPLRLTGLISLLPKGLSRVFSSSTVRKHQILEHVINPSLNPLLLSAVPKLSSVFPRSKCRGCTQTLPESLTPASLFVFPSLFLASPALFSLFLTSPLLLPVWPNSCRLRHCDITDRLTNQDVFRWNPGTIGALRGAKMPCWQLRTTFSQRLWQAFTIDVPPGLPGPRVATSHALKVGWTIYLLFLNLKPLENASYWVDRFLDKNSNCHFLKNNFI